MFLLWQSLLYLYRKKYLDVFVSETYLVIFYSYPKIFLRLIEYEIKVQFFSLYDFISCLKINKQRELTGVKTLEQ